MLCADESAKRVPVDERLFIDDDERRIYQRGFERRRAACNGSSVRRRKSLERFVLCDAKVKSDVRVVLSYWVDNHFCFFAQSVRCERHDKLRLWTLARDSPG